MLREEEIARIREEIKGINRIKNMIERVEMMIKLKNEVHEKFNDELDDLFAEVNLKERKLNLE